MDSSVTLIVTRGPLAGRKFVFDDRRYVSSAASRDCTIALPLEAEHLDVSRHHCVVEIGPYSVRVRDLGSLNGTYVNGKKIGQRWACLAPADMEGTRQPAVALIDGDEIQLGEHTAFRVCIFTPKQEDHARTQRLSSGELHFEMSLPS